MKRRYRIWKSFPSGLWCVSPDHRDGNTRRPPFIMAKDYETVLTRLCNRIKKYGSPPTHIRWEHAQDPRSRKFRKFIKET